MKIINISGRRSCSCSVNFLIEFLQECNEFFWLAVLKNLHLYFVHFQRSRRRVTAHFHLDDVCMMLINVFFLGKWNLRGLNTCLNVRTQPVGIYLIIHVWMFVLRAVSRLIDKLHVVTFQSPIRII